MVDNRMIYTVAVLGGLTDTIYALLDSHDNCTYVVVDELDKLPEKTIDNLRVIVIGEGITRDSVERYLPSIRETNPSLTVLGVKNTEDLNVGSELDNWVDQVFILPAEKDNFVKQLGSSLSDQPRFTRVFGIVVKKSARFIISMIFLLLVWTIIVKLFDLPPYLLPTPKLVFNSFFEQYSSFLMHMGITAYESFAGFILGNVLGIGSAIILHRYYRLQEFTMPIFISLQAIPIVALAPLLIVWLGTGLVSKVAMAAIICFFPMVVNTLQAFSSVDRDYQELFRFHRADYFSTLKLLLIPASFPSIISALRISAGLAVVGAIVAELTGANKGLGYILLNASYRLETDKMFVAMLLSALLGMIFFQLPTLLRIFTPRTWNLDTRT